MNEFHTVDHSIWSTTWFEWINYMIWMDQFPLWLQLCCCGILHLHDTCTVNRCMCTFSTLSAGSYWYVSFAYRCIISPCHDCEMRDSIIDEKTVKQLMRYFLALSFVCRAKNSLFYRYFFFWFISVIASNRPL